MQNPVIVGASEKCLQLPLSSRLPALLGGSRGRFVSFYNSRPCNTSWIRVPKPAKQGGHCLKRGLGDSLYVMSQSLRSSWVKTALLPAGSRAELLKRLYSRLRFSPPQTRKTRRDTTAKIFRSCSERGTLLVFPVDSRTLRSQQRMHKFSAALRFVHRWQQNPASWPLRPCASKAKPAPEATSCFRLRQSGFTDPRAAAVWEPWWEHPVSAGRQGPWLTLSASLAH